MITTWDGKNVNRKKRVVHLLQRQSMRLQRRKFTEEYYAQEIKRLEAIALIADPNYLPIRDYTDDGYSIPSSDPQRSIFSRVRNLFKH